MAIINGVSDIDKIDSATTLGLRGADDSLAYRVTEIERHLHSYERWFGLAASPSAELHRADRASAAAGPFIIDAGNAAFGSWLQILGSTDTPATAGQVKFDMHRLLFTATERDNLYVIQIAFGETGDGAVTAGAYVEVPFIPASNQIDSGPVDIMSRRITAGTKGWARCICPGQNTATMSFYFGLHEYEG